MVEINRIANTPCPLAEREQWIAEAEADIDRLQRTEEAIVVATGAPREAVCLPITVDEVGMWWQQLASPMIEAAVEGAILLSRVDMVAAWPLVWNNDTAARRTLEQLKAAPQAMETLIANWRPVTYQLRGPKQKRRAAFFDPAIVPDPKAWLEAKLGPIQVFPDDGPEFRQALIGL